MSINTAFLIPNVQPSSPAISERSTNIQKKDGPSEFDQALQRVDANFISGSAVGIHRPLKFSAHAMSRMKERNIDMDPELMVKIREAVDRAETKGIQDSLIIGEDAAWIVNVGNRTVVTAMDRGAMTGNIFTNIDGAVVIS